MKYKPERDCGQHHADEVEHQWRRILLDGVFDYDERRSPDERNQHEENVGFQGSRHVLGENSKTETAGFNSGTLLPQVKYRQNSHCNERQKQQHSNHEHYERALLLARLGNRDAEKRDVHPEQISARILLRRWFWRDLIG